LEEFDVNKKGEEVLDPQVAYLINSVLSDVGTRLGPNMTISGQVNAAKTGTSNKKVNGINIPSNLWTMGYTTNLVTGVWAGNSDDRKTGTLSLNANGYDAAAPIWKSFMTKAYALKGYPSQDFPRPPGIQDITVSAATGKLPGANVPPEGLRSDVFASFGIPTEVDNLFAKVKVDKRNDLLANEFCPPEFVEERTYRQHHSIDPSNVQWEQGVQAWAAGMIAKATAAGETAGIPPSVVSPLCNKEQFNSTRSVKIVDPSNYAKVDPGKLEIRVNVKSTFDIDKVTFSFDGNLQNTVYDAPYTGEVRISRFIEEGSVHTIQATLHDINGYTAQSSIEIRMNGDGVDDTEDIIIDTDGLGDEDPASPEIEIVNTDA
ncbi:hypothetical protein KKD70_02700, partial [Patescibacteria group bacterium]|nr:hypothetical protein [Patescibacteria group bacterium]